MLVAFVARIRYERLRLPRIYRLDALMKACAILVISVADHPEHGGVRRDDRGDHSDHGTDFHASVNFAFWGFSEVRIQRILRTSP